MSDARGETSNGRRAMTMGGVEREARRCGRRRTVRAAVAIDGCIDERDASRGEGFKSRGEPTRTRD